MRSFALALVVMALSVAAEVPAAEALRVGVFDVDASPAIGSPMAYDPTREVTTPLSCRGVVILGKEAPIVLCAIDWIGLANDGYKEFREGFAKAAKTSVDRVAVHALHQHDAPDCDFSADALLAEQGVNREVYDAKAQREVIERAGKAIAAAMESAVPVTHLGLGSAAVEKVASNRRILGPDGKVKYVRYTAAKDPKLREFPEGVIDPLVRSISFWNENKPIAVLTYYATHPQSYYRTGQANPDFPGLARNARQQATSVPHIHFNGAGGNIGAGKYNDGAHENRQILADRVADGMKRAWEATKKQPVTASDVSWKNVPVAMPVATYLDEDRLRSEVEDSKKPPRTRAGSAKKLTWVRRCKAGEKVDISCLVLANARVLHLPGELFVEYQLAAQQLRPDLFVAMAAYGEYAMSYIGTEVAYFQGGYETEPRSSSVSPDVERVLMSAMRTLLDAPTGGPAKLGSP